jgi:DNA-directed RNA polymerase specialized sigma24 family protein
MRIPTFDGHARLAAVAPLTRRNAAGLLLERDEAVTKPIADALGLDDSELIERARVSIVDSPRYLQEECLAYFIRDCRRRGDTWLGEQLAEILVGRCSRFINSRARAALSGAYAEDCIGDILYALAKQLLAPDDRSDYAQVRFWVFLDRIVIGAVRVQLRALRRDRRLVSIGEEASDDESSIPLRLADTMTPPPDRLAVASEGLATLEEPFRQAFVLRHYCGWPIGGDASHPSISGHFGVKPRTIQNWLRKAETRLEAWRGGDHDE